MKKNYGAFHDAVTHIYKEAYSGDTIEKLQNDILYNLPWTDKQIVLYGGHEKLTKLIQSSYWKLINE